MKGTLKLLDARQAIHAHPRAVFPGNLKESTMTDNARATLAPRKLWVRALLMLLMGMAFQLAAWVLVAVALLQLGFALFTDQPNQRLQGFGRSVGRYLAQIAAFASFATEALPFPFSDWPTGDL
jgi:hypothetical protein